MTWKLFLINDTTEIFSLAILLGATFFSYKLMIKDKKISWNYVSIAISFLAISIGFSIFDEIIGLKIAGVIGHLFMMLSALTFAGVLLIAKKQKDGLK